MQGSIDNSYLAVSYRIYKLRVALGLLPLTNPMCPRASDFPRLLRFVPRCHLDAGTFIVKRHTEVDACDSRFCPRVHGSSTFSRLKEPQLLAGLLQLIPLVEKSLHQLLLLVAIGQNFADGLGHQPEIGVPALAAASEELSHAHA